MRSISSKPGPVALLVSMGLVFVSACDLSRPSVPTQSQRLAGTGNCVAVSDDGDLVAVGTHGRRIHSDRGVVSIRSVSTLDPICDAVDVQQWITMLEFVSNESGFVAAVSSDLRLNRLWDWSFETGSIELISLTGDRQTVVPALTNEITSMAVSPNKQSLAVCYGGSSAVRPACSIYTLPGGQLMSTFSPVETGLLHVVFSNDSQQCLVIRGADGSVRLPDDMDVRAYLISASDGKLIQEQQLRKESKDMVIAAIAGAPDAPEVFITTGQWIGQCTVSEGQFKFEVLPFPKALSYYNATMLAYHAPTHRLAIGEDHSGSHTGSSVIYVDVKTRETLSQQIVVPAYVSDIAFARDGKSLFTVGASPESYTKGVIQKYELDGF